MEVTAGVVYSIPGAIAMLGTRYAAEIAHPFCWLVIRAVLKLLMKVSPSLTAAMTWATVVSLDTVKSG